MFTIYKATNTLNGKSYIGFDSNWPQRQKDHKYLAETHKSDRYFHTAIRHDGWNKFIWTIEYQSEDKNLTLHRMEPYFINLFETTDRTKGYNLTEGGDGVSGYKHSTEARQKMSERMKGTKLRLGKPFSEESKRKISEKVKGNTSHLGHVHSSETKTQMSASHIAYWASPEGQLKIINGREKRKIAAIKSWESRRIVGKEI